MCCGQCTRWQIQYVQTGSILEKLRLYGVAGSSPFFLCLDVAASIRNLSDVAASLFLLSQYCYKRAPKKLYCRQLDGETIADERTNNGTDRDLNDGSNGGWRNHTCCLHLRHQVVLRVNS